MLLCTVLVDALHAAFEHAERALNGIGGHVAASVFLAAVLNGFVSGVFLADLAIEKALIGLQPALFRDVLANDLANGFLGRAANMEHADLGSALHKPDDSALGASTATPAASVGLATALRRRRRVFLHLAHVRLINLDNLALAAHGSLEPNSGHGEPQT